MTREHVIPAPSDTAGYVAATPSAARRYRDLCSTCKHAETCAGRSTLEHPIFFCEMFEVEVPRPTLALAAGPEPSERPESSEYKGLCVNCENRDTCTITKPEGGIWHCEEYQ